MKHITKGSKLIIIYIATVIVSGSILTYLSINSISNYGELTEKRISEEQKQTAERFRQEFQSSIVTITKTINQQVSTDSLFLRKGNLPVRDIPSELVLIMNNRAELIQPQVLPIDYVAADREPSTSYLRYYHLGEENEFILQNYEQAITAYNRALLYARESADSAQIYTTLGRLFLKLDNEENSFLNYRILLQDFGQTLNNFGYPFSYLSIEQLSKIKAPELNDALNALYIRFIEDLSANKIPINNATRDLLTRLETTLNNKPEFQNDSLIKNSFCQLYKILDGVDAYEGQMHQYFDFQLDSIPKVNDFDVLMNTDISEQLFVVKNYGEFLVGFVIQLQLIFEMAMFNMDLTGNSYDFRIALVGDNDLTNNTNASLGLRSPFSPFFTGKNISITLVNQQVVSDRVLNRAITTIVGLILLLGAMILGLYTLIQDVDRKKHMESLRANFIANVTHELKTPLTSINMFSDTILMGRAKNEKTLMKYARIIVKESEKLKRMINNILEFSRQENQKLDFDLKEESLSAVIYDIMDEMNYWLELNGFEVNLELDERINATVDSEGLKQVLSNLITNAIKYSEKQKKIEIRLYQKGKYAIIEVEDHGIGIEEEQLPRIFEKFYRVKSSTTGNVSGTGLGLRVSKDIIEALNGKLTVASEPNKGSTFTIALISIAPES